MQQWLALNSLDIDITKVKFNLKADVFEKLQFRCLL